MAKSKEKNKLKKENLKVKRKIEMYVSQGMELNDAIIKVGRKNTPSIIAKRKRMAEHWKSAKQCKGTRKNMRSAKIKRDTSKTPIIPVGFEYKKR